MPEGDGVTGVPFDVPLPQEESAEETSAVPQEPDMEPDKFAGLLMNQLAQSGVIAQNNFVTVQKIVDYDYLEGKRMVTLDEAVGIREVQAKETPGGPANANR